MREAAQNNSANGGPNTALEGTSHGVLNVSLEGAR